METAVRVHFVGIGGISMSSLAGITMKKGYAVSGSDRTPSNLTRRLEDEGAVINYQHLDENVEGASLVVYTAAVHGDNPEISGAEKRGIPLCSRADYLGWLMSSYRERIGVAGTHGKSTVTSMLAEVFMKAANPTVVSGAELADMNGAYRIGDEKEFIFEACEYCDSFLSFCPTIAVITNIDYDHADYFKTMDQLRASFEKYVSYADKAVLNFDDPESVLLAGKYSGKILSYALEAKAEHTAKNISFENGCGSFDLVKNDETVCRIKLSVPGRHNVLNALAASAAALECGVSPDDISAGLEKYHGAVRRFEYLGKLPSGALVYDDYAHHPTEIKATLAAARAFGKRIVAVFQPHTYTRTASLFDDFAAALGGADITVLADIYAARETGDCGVSSELLEKSTHGGMYLGGMDKICEYLTKNTDSGDLILILGAGDIIKLGKMLFE